MLRSLNVIVMTKKELMWQYEWIALGKRECAAVIPILKDQNLENISQVSRSCSPQEELGSHQHITFFLPVK